MRRSAVLKGIHQKSELLLGLFGAETQKLEHAGLKAPVVNPNGSAADFVSVEHNVVGVGPHRARVGFKKGNVFGLGACEGMVHGKPAAGIFVPFQKREVDHPKRCELKGLAQSEFLAKVQSKFTQGLAGFVGSAGEHQHEVAGLGAKGLGPIF